MIFDLHNDLLNSNIKTKKKIEYLNKHCFENDLSDVVLPVFTDAEKLDNKKIEEFNEIKKGLLYINTYLAFENLAFLNDRNIDSLICLKPLYASLTWNNMNTLAGGCLSDIGLTNFGERAAKKLTDNGIYIDVAHLNSKSFFKLASKIDKPIINSHTCFHMSKKCSRNISDDEIKVIIESGGLIGFTFVRKFVKNGKCNIRDIANNLDMFIQKYGNRNISIGTDFYGTKDLPRHLKDYTGFKLLRNELKMKGYRDTEIDYVFSENSKKFFKKKDRIL